jgi:hypothetical protein
VCDGDLDTLGTLVDQSLVRAERERFGMLETIREYACDLLEARADAGETRRAHAAYYLRLASPRRYRAAGGPTGASPTTTTSAPRSGSRSTPGRA